MAGPSTASLYIATASSYRSTLKYMSPALHERGPGWRVEVVGLFVEVGGLVVVLVIRPGGFRRPEGASGARALSGHRLEEGLEAREREILAGLARALGEYSSVAIVVLGFGKREDVDRRGDLARFLGVVILLDGAVIAQLALGAPGAGQSPFER